MMEDNSHKRDFPEYTNYILMVQEYTNYVLLMEGNSHLREKYTDYVFTVHEYIYRVVPFAFNSHRLVKSIQTSILSMISPIGRIKTG